MCPSGSGNANVTLMKLVREEGTHMSSNPPSYPMFVNMCLTSSKPSLFLASCHPPITIWRSSVSSRLFPGAAAKCGDRGLLGGVQDPLPRDGVGERGCAVCNSLTCLSSAEIRDSELSCLSECSLSPVSKVSSLIECPAISLPHSRTS